MPIDPPEKNYFGPLPISKAKYADLMGLCKSGVIPAPFHGWYKDLKVSARVIDAIPEQSDDE